MNQASIILDENNWKDENILTKFFKEDWAVQETTGNKAFECNDDSYVCARESYFDFKTLKLMIEKELSEFNQQDP